MKSEAQLAIASFPEVIAGSSPIYQELLDIHHDLLLLADGLATAAGGTPAEIPPDTEPDNWDNWPMNFLHKVNMEYGENILAGDALAIGLTDGKAYRYTFRTDKTFPVPGFPAAPFTQRPGSDCFAVALESGEAGAIRQVMLYGASRVPDLTLAPVWPPQPTWTEYDAYPGAADSSTPTLIVAEAGNIATVRANPAGNGVNTIQGTGWYLGGQFVMVTGGKWYPENIS